MGDMWLGWVPGLVCLGCLSWGRGMLVGGLGGFTDLCPGGRGGQVVEVDDVGVYCGGWE